ncbi:MAG: hypothetical protein ACTSPR_03455 [Candidatus Thorarchaeota archaeon]
MLRIGRKAILITFTLSMLLLVFIVTPASALYVSATQETHSQEVSITDENKGYVYSSYPPFGTRDALWLDINQDVGLNAYRYQGNSWVDSTDFVNGPAVTEYTFTGQATYFPGWLDDAFYLPVFTEFVNTTNDDLELAVDQKRNVFPLGLGQQSSIILEPYLHNSGTLTLSTEEFIHVTIACRTDSALLEVIVYDPEGRNLGSVAVDGGDVKVLPFRPSGPGTYTIRIYPHAPDEGLLVAEILPVAVAPQIIQYGEVVDDVLSGSEFVMDAGSGSIVITEKAPTARTYKFSSNLTHAGKIAYSINYPSFLLPVHIPYEPELKITSDAFSGGSNPMRYQTQLWGDIGHYYYQSFQGEFYYLTVIGMDEAVYSIYNEELGLGQLPLSEAFYLENNNLNTHTVAYQLSLDEDSIIKVNATNNVGGYGWELFTVFDDMMYRATGLTVGLSFHSALGYYVPAGEYVVMGEGGSPSSGYYQFTVGSILDNPSTLEVSDGSVLGARFDVSTVNWYLTNISLLTQDNITVSADYTFYTTNGLLTSGYSMTLGNREVGGHWMAFGNNFTTRSLSSLADGFLVVAISPYQVQNNTAGPGNMYPGYTVEYGIEFEDRWSEIFNQTASITAETTSASHNFTLGDPGDASETYGLSIACEEGVWYNVSVIVSDVSSWYVLGYQNYTGCTQYLDWPSLNDRLVGSTGSEAAFQVGAISNEILLSFHATRTLAGEGSFYVEITPLVSNQLHELTIESLGVPPGAIDWVLLGGGIGVVAVVVVGGLLIAKKKGKGPYSP